MSGDRERFERAFVALSYVLGRRGADLLEPLAAPLPIVAELARRLAHPERAARAQVLAAELAPVVQALDAWSYR